MSNQEKEYSKADFAAAERESLHVNNEQVIAAALFAKQLQSDLVGIKKAQIGDSLKVPNVDMSKVMPSEIYKTFKPTGVTTRPPPPPALQTLTATIPVPTQETISSSALMKSSEFTTTLINSSPEEKVDNNQLEFNFDKVSRYGDVIEAIEKLENKINIVNEKLEILIQDKKKLKKTTINGTLAG